MPPPKEAKALAAAWLARLVQAAAPAEEQLPEDGPVAVLAEFVAAVIAAGRTLLVAVPDDDLLPALSNALELALRPLCLVLPQPDFAAPTALRATFSLLKSRLVRGGESSHAAAWEAQRERIERCAELWDAALAWCSGSKDSTLPAHVGELFPVNILPAERVAALAGAQRDFVVILDPERMQNGLPRLLQLGRGALLLRAAGRRAPSGGALALGDEEAWLGAELELLTQQLSEMELEFATAQAELAAFTRRYYERVGTRMAELDLLQARIARLLAAKMPDDIAARRNAQEARAQAERSQRESMGFAELDRESEKPFIPSVGLKRLFRYLAQKIHPDRAEGEADRTWRTELMSEANRAYRNGDEVMLREILAQWEEGPVAASQLGKGAAQGLAAHIAKMQTRLSEIETELNRLFASRLYELFVAEKLAKERGRELLQEMSDKLDTQIVAAHRGLEQLEAS